MSTDVKLFDGGREWSMPWFADILIRGLENSGLSRPAAQALANLIKTSRPDGLSRLRSAAAELPADQHRDEIVAALEELLRISTFNANCYRRLDREQERVVAWPNNPRTRVLDPQRYVDIFEDLPYRSCPRFISPGTPIGSAGSCFALRIAHQLQAWGYNYVIEEDDLPAGVPIDRLSETSYRMAPARCGTLFNVPSMRQMVERAFGVQETEKILVQSDGRILDPFRSTKALYNDETGYLADYDRHTAALRSALQKCEVFILTLGLTEAWKFAHSGEFTSIAPFRIDPAVVRPHVLSVAENIAELERLYEIYKQYRPGIKLIISVSPIPLNKTFSTRHHVVTANCVSKATLRVAAEEFCNAHPDDVFYFPSYEVVTHCTENAWEADMRHVSSKAVERVMTLFRTMYLVDQSSSLRLLEHTEPVHKFSPRQRFKGKVKEALGALGLRS